MGALDVGGFRHGRKSDYFARRVSLFILFFVIVLVLGSIVPSFLDLEERSHV